MSAGTGLALLPVGKLLGQPLTLGWEPVTKYSISVLDGQLRGEFYIIAQVVLRTEPQLPTAVTSTVGHP